MPKDFKDIVSKLKQITQDKLNEVYIPSSKTIAKFVPFNIKQQKEVLNTISEGNSSPVEFAIVVLQSILENNVDKVPLLSIDRNSILLQMREQSISKTIKGIDSEQNELEINIRQIVEKINGEGLPELSKEVNYSTIKVSLNVPTIEHEINVNRGIKHLIGDGKDEKVKKIVGDIYIAELTKYVLAISVEGEDIEFHKLGIADKIAIISTFNHELSKEILDFASKVKQYEAEAEKITIGEVKYKIDLDVAFLG